MTGRDLYEIIGVGRDATADEIRAAYRRRAKLLHPDAGGDQALFQELVRAWEVLGDEELRRRYDETGEIGETIERIEEQALAMIAEIVDKVATADTPAGVDLAATIRTVIATDMRRGAEVLGTVQALETNLDKLVGRFHTTGEIDPIRRILEDKRRAAQKDIAEVSRMLRVAARAAVIMATYSFDVEQPRNPRWSQASTTWATYGV